MTVAEGSQETQTPGRFWIEGGPQVAGRLIMGERAARVVTDTPIRESQSMRANHTETARSLELSLDPQAVVADTIPAHVLGTLDDGNSVTLIDAAIDTAEVSFHQVHSGIKLIVGTHVPTADAALPAARVALPSPRAWRGLHDGLEPVEVNLGDVEGNLRSYVEDEDLWIELTLTAGLTEREWERRFWWRCITLLNLWSVQDLRPLHVQLRASEGEHWAELKAWRGTGSKPMSTHDSLLDPRFLTLQDVAQALVLFDSWAPIQDIASKHLQYEVTLELAVLSYASALEGLHRRCYESSKVFSELSNSVARKVAKSLSHVDEG